MESPSARLFLALWPAPGVRAGLLAWRDAWDWPRKATPVRTGQLHLTLHFIGDVARARVPALAHALAVPVAPFALRFGHAALWHHGVAVAEPCSAPARLLALHGELGQVLLAHGLPLDPRPYRPHVTLARRAAPAIARAGPPLRWQVRSYALMESRADGYVTLRRYGAI